MKKNFIEQIFLFSLVVPCIAQANVSEETTVLNQFVNDVLTDPTKGCCETPACCAPGPRCLRGETGPIGPRGRRGLATPKAYGYMLDTTTQTVTDTSSITFNTNYFAPVGMTHTP